MLFSKSANVSMVAFYQIKPPELITLIQDIQAQLINDLKISVEIINDCRLEQIHATIIGCEGLTTDRGIINYNFYQLKKEHKCINLVGLIDYLHNNIKLPLKINFGGYHPQQNYNFLSRNQHPYVRSFQLKRSREQEFIPVLIGWTFANNCISQELDYFRKGFLEFNLLHKYYSQPDSVDNDFYLRLGTIKGHLNDDDISIIENNIREFLANRSPMNINLDIEDLAFVKYQDMSLPPETTKILPVLQTTISSLAKLYS